MALIQKSENRDSSVVESENKDSSGDKSENRDSSVDKSENRVSVVPHFWGICCEYKKIYKQTVHERFRLTMAVLDPKSNSRYLEEKTVLLIVKRLETEYLLCVLKHEEIYQVNLDLIFGKGEEITFFVKGCGDVWLSGYVLTDSESDVLNDKNRYLCPLVEVKSPNSNTEKKGKGSKTPQMLEKESVESRSKRKAKGVQKDLIASAEKGPVRKRNAFLNKKNNSEIEILNMDSDDSDEDFHVCDEESECDDEADLEEYLDPEELTGQKISDLKTYSDEDGEEEEEEEEDEEEEEEQQQEKQVILDSKGSQKRKRSKDLCVEDEDSSNSDPMNSSIGHTPMPKKQKNIETSSEKKTSKKEKRLSEISNLSEKPAKGWLKSPVAESTPNRLQNSPGFVQKLEGGVEIQEVIVGRGPVAAKGKTAHVFYVARLEDKTIFDSRLPGKKPFSFKIGSSQVIKGLEIGIQGMQVGGKRKLKIPPSMGYGKEPREGIPRNSTLFFVLELQAVS